jgi:hypothetical protein
MNNSVALLIVVLFGIGVVCFIARSKAERPQDHLAKMWGAAALYCVYPSIKLLFF